jgi:hypothetical protein
MHSISFHHLPSNCSRRLLFREALLLLLYFEILKPSAMAFQFVLSCRDRSTGRPCQTTTSLSHALFAIMGWTRNESFIYCLFSTFLA